MANWFMADPLLSFYICAEISTPVTKRASCVVYVSITGGRQASPLPSSGDSDEDDDLVDSSDLLEATLTSLSGGSFGLSAMASPQTAWKSRQRETKGKFSTSTQETSKTEDSVISLIHNNHVSRKCYTCLHFDLNGTVSYIYRRLRRNRFCRLGLNTWTVFLETWTCRLNLHRRRLHQEVTTTIKSTLRKRGRRTFKRWTRRWPRDSITSRPLQSPSPWTRSRRRPRVIILRPRRSAKIRWWGVKDRGRPIRRPTCITR